MGGKRIFIDTETTGLNSEGGDEIIQVGICDDRGRKLYEEKFRPSNNSTWESAERVHGISPASLLGKKTIDENRDSIQKILDDADEIAMYNASFDSGFLRAAGLEIDDAKVRDVLPEARSYFKDSGLTEDARLGTIADHIGFKCKKHDALDDAKATAAIAAYMEEDEGKKRVRRPSGIPACLIALVILGVGVFVAVKLPVEPTVHAAAVSLLSFALALALFRLTRLILGGKGSDASKRRVLRAVADFLVIALLCFLLAVVPVAVTEETLIVGYTFSGILGLVIFGLLIRMHSNMGY